MVTETLQTECPVQSQQEFEKTANKRLKNQKGLTNNTAC